MRRPTRSLVGAFLLAACGSDPGTTLDPKPDGGPIALPEEAGKTAAPCAVRFGDAASQAVRDIAVDRSGRTIAVGQFQGAFSVGTTKLTSPVGITSSFLVGFDSTCTPTFAKSFHDGLVSVAVDAAGSIYVATTGVDIAKDLVTFGGGTFLAKLSPTADVLWSKSIANTLPQQYTHTTVAQIHANASGALLFTGLLDNPQVRLGDGSSIGDPLGDDDIEAAIALTTDGTITWSAWAQPSLTLGSLFGAIDDDGNVALAGECADTATIALIAQPCDHGFLAKVRADGKTLWFRNGPFEGGPLAFDPKGDVLALPKMAKAEKYPVDFPAGTKVDDRILLKLAKENGLVRWANVTGTSPMPAAISGISGIATNTDGTIFLSGDGRASTYAGISRRIFLAEIAADGTPRRAAAYGDAPMTVTRPVVAPDGAPIIGGALVSQADFGTGIRLVSTQWSSGDAFVVRSPSLAFVETAPARSEPPAAPLLSTTPNDVSDGIANPTGIFLRGASALYWCPLTGCAPAEKVADNLESGQMATTADAVYLTTYSHGVSRCTRTGCEQVAPDGNPATAITTDAASFYFVRDSAPYSCPLAGCPAEGAFWMTGPVAPTAITLQGSTFYADDGHTVVACTLPVCDTTRTVFVSGDGNAAGRPFASSSNGLFVATHDMVVHCPLEGACDAPSTFAGNTGNITLAGSDIYLETGHDIDALFTSSLSKCPQTGCPAEGPAVVAASGRSFIYEGFVYFVGNGKLLRAPR